MKVKSIRYRFCPQCGKPYSFPVHGRDNAWEVSSVNEHQYRVRCFHCGFVTPITQHDITFETPDRFADDDIVEHRIYPDLKPILKPDRLAKLREKYGLPIPLRAVLPSDKLCGYVVDVDYVSGAVAVIIELLDMLEGTHPTALSVEVDMLRRERVDLEDRNRELYDDFSEGRDEIENLKGALEAEKAEKVVTGAAGAIFAAMNKFMNALPKPTGTDELRNKGELFDSLKSDFEAQYDKVWGLMAEIKTLRRENETDHKLLIRVRDLWRDSCHARDGLQRRLYVDILERLKDDPQT